MDQEAITQYIENVLQRAPLPGEVETYQTLINNGSTTLDGVLMTIIDSSEAVDGVYPIVLTYQAVYGRVPDAAGINYWVNVYENNAGLDDPNTTTVDEALVEVLKAFVNPVLTPEFVDRYGANPTGDQFVAAAYQNVLNRAPDAAGLNYWQDRYAEIEASYAGSGLTQEQINVEVRAQILEQFVESVEFKVATDAAVDAYLTALALEQDTAGFDLFDFGGGTPGETFVLTTSADNIMGTVGNDLITGLVTDDDEGVNGVNTFGPGDNIDGGIGVDTLRITMIDNTDNFGDGFGAGATVTNVEILEIRQAYSTDADFDLSGFSGLEQIVADMTYDTDFNFYNLQEELISVTLNGTRAGETSRDMEVNLYDVSNSIYTGDDDTITINVINAGNEESNSSASFYVTNEDGDEVLENYNVVVGGDNNYLYINNNTNADGDDIAKTITVSNMLGNSGSLYLELDEQEALESVDASAMTGDFSFEFWDTDDGQEVTVTTGSGDDTIFLYDGTFTVDLGAGDDRVELGTYGSDADDTDDILDGGAGRDTISMDPDAIATLMVLNPVNFEILGLSAGASAPVTVDADDYGFDEITLEADIGQTLTLEDFNGGQLNIEADQNGGIVVENNTLADTLDILIDSSSTVDLFGGLDLTDVETVSFSSADEDSDLNITNSLNVTGVDALSFSGEGDVDINVAATGADDVGSVDLSGLTGQFDNDGFTFFGAQTDIMIGNIGDNSIIELSATPGQNILEFGADLDNDITIDLFEAGPSVTDDVLDLSAFGITGLGDLVLTDSGADVDITSDAFDGTITLTGVLTADLALGNFIFA